MPSDPAGLSPALRAYAAALERVHGNAEAARDQPPAKSFAALLEATLTEAVASGRAGEAAASAASAGTLNLQEVVEAVTAAELSLETVVAVRDRVIAAYQDIIRMPI